ncbi:efflux transporter outer membrane subunit [Caulobacter sp. S45]|uniref:efflux transporter outer membrane subunit n=1 Tax=Caulobacter sp. S45 TaxID=1641861 RepID=UPI001C20B3DB|nr:efflux transporter outer membrane subunit [Caulobacter sp. S45]
MMGRGRLRSCRRGGAWARLRRPWIGGLLLPLLAGCAVGPDFHAPAAPSDAGFTHSALPDPTVSSPVKGGEAQSFTTGAVPYRWWELFRSPEIDRLVEQALRANPDLQSAQAALRSARENFYAARGALYPQVSIDLNASRQKNPVVLASPLSSNANYFGLNTAQLDISYSPDLFGGVRRQIEANAAQADNQLFTSEATYLSLTTNVVLAALQEASLREQIEATRRSIAIAETLLADLRFARKAGQTAEGDVAAQESVLAQARLLLPPLEKQLAQQKDLLAVLTGGTPNTMPDDTVELDGVTLPTDLPLSLPSQIVAQRPDIRAAAANLHVASALVGVAQANRLPNITLTALLGGTSNGFDNLFTADNSLYTLGAGLTQPIFQGGALLHRKRAAQAAYAQAQAVYRSTVHQAFQNVADTLQALDQDARNLQAAVQAQTAAARSLALLRQAFQAGEVGSVAVLNDEQAYESAVAVLVQARAARYADTVALFQALGGGWGDRAGLDIASAK